MIAGAAHLAAAFAALSALLGVPASGEKKPAAERWYSMHVDGKRTGYLRVVETRTGDKAVPLRFTYEAVVRHGDGPIHVHVQISARDDRLLTPVKIAWRAEHDDHTERSEATIDWSAPGGGLLTGSTHGGKVERKLPPNTTTETGVLEVVRRLPFRKGLAIACQVVEFTNLGIRRDRRILYLGEEEVEAAGRSQKLHRFEHREEGRLHMTLWVNAAHELVRVRDRHGMVLELTTKDKALEPLK